jgi:CRISPR-associated protein Csb2
MVKTRASSPPLLRTVRYVRPESCMETNPPNRPARRSPTAHAVLFGLDCTVLPLVTATIEVAEQIRVRLMGAHRKRMGGDLTKVSPLFSGKDDGRKRLDHGHVFILPIANGKGRLDRVLLLSKNRAFSEDELDAVRGVQRLWQSDERPEVRCVITWQGDLDAVPLGGRKNVVVSRTPFVTVRHPHKNRDFTQFLSDELKRECRNHGLDEPVAVQPCRVQGLFESIEYRRNRKDDPPRPGYGFKLTFEKPVTTPFSLGYGCHFGLGQFRGVDEV